MTGLEVLRFQLNDLREKVAAIKATAVQHHTCCCIQTSYMIDCIACAYCCFCHSCSHCTRCSDCIYCSICINCTNCEYCTCCEDCSSCYGCNSVTGKRYMVYNIQLTKEEYQQVMREVL